MNELSIARRYARALHEESLNAGIVDEIDQDVLFLEESLEQARDLRRVFESPIIPRHRKLAVVRGLFEERIQPLMLRFIELMIEKNRERLFPRVVEAYRQLRDHEQGIVEAQARVATELSDRDREEMERRLERLTGKRVRLRVEHDSSLVGGAVVRIGDTVYDGSVRNKLAALRGQMEQGSFGMN